MTDYSELRDKVSERVAEKTDYESTTGNKSLSFTILVELDNLAKLLSDYDKRGEEIERLRKALKPFAAYGKWLDEHYSDHEDEIIVAGPLESNMTFGDFRRARDEMGGE